MIIINTMNSKSNVVNIADYTTTKIREQKTFASEVDKQIGIRIRIARHMNGRKQEELANYLGLTLPYFSFQVRLLTSFFCLLKENLPPVFS